MNRRNDNNNNKPATNNGQPVIIAVCGIHGAGKTTLLSGLRQLFVAPHHLFFKNTCYDNIRLIEYLHPYYEVTEVQRDNPVYTAPYIWAKTLDYLQYFRSYIEPALTEPNLIISDRWSYCYQALAMTIPDIAETTAHMLQVFPRPDITIYLDCAPEEAYQRLIARGLTTPEENVGQLDLLRSNYKQFFDEIGRDRIIEVPQMPPGEAYSYALRALYAKRLLPKEMFDHTIHP